MKWTADLRAIYTTLRAFRAAEDRLGQQEGSAGHSLCLPLAGAARIHTTDQEGELAIEALTLRSFLSEKGLELEA